MQASSIKVLRKSRAEQDFDNILDKCKSKNWSNVIDFLKDKATNSTHTAVNYWTGISHLNDFLEKQYNRQQYDVQTIIEPLKQERIDVYELMRLFKLYLMHDCLNHDKIAIGSVINYIKSAKSYFMFSDLDIVDHKFKARVKMPQLYKEDEQALDSNDIVEILHHIDNRRLKAYVLMLASGGMRAVEGLAVRESDIDWSGINFESHNPKDMLEPASVKIRKEYSKTRRPRNIFISNEAARYLNEWLDWKYRYQKPTAAKARADAAAEGELIFSRVGRGREADPSRLYTSMAFEFGKVLDKIKSRKFGVRKNDGNSVIPRRVITLHSFRRYVKTVVETHTSESYSEYILGHAKSSYFTKKPEENRRIYKEDAMSYLTFLDYPALEQTAKNFEDKLKAEIKKKDEQIADLEEKLKETQERDIRNTSSIGGQSDEIVELKKQMAYLMKKIGESS